MSEPRFTVLTVTGYAIRPEGTVGGNQPWMLSATVFDRAFQREIVTYRSTDRRPATLLRLRGAACSRVCACGGPKSPRAHRCAGCAKREGWYAQRYYGEAGALVAAAERCAELNAWDEHEGDEEYVPLASGRENACER